MRFFPQSRHPWVPLFSLSACLLVYGFAEKNPTSVKLRGFQKIIPVAINASFALVPKLRGRKLQTGGRSWAEKEIPVSRRA